MDTKKLLPPSTLFIFILLLLSSCGSFEKEKKKLLTESENKDLAAVFDTNKEQAEIFKKDEPLPEEKNLPPIESENETKTKTKKASKKMGPVLPPRPPEPVLPPRPPELAPPEKVNVKVEAPVEDVKAATGFAYPSDYPQILKDYDAKSEAIWKIFKPIFHQGEQSIMAISYLGVTAGYITIESKDIVKINDRWAYYYFARFKSKDIYSYFYWLDDKLETYIDKITFLPMKYSLIQREKKQNVDDLQLFNFDKLKTYHWYKRVKVGNDKNEKIENYIPRFAQDSFSALQFVRGLPMIKGEKYDFPVITRGQPWLLKVEVLGEEVTSVDGNDILSYRLRAETHFPGVLQKSGDINFWYAADEGRRLLKFKAKVKIGSIYGELIEYKPGVLVK
jgi:hypothetical protein